MQQNRIRMIYMKGEFIMTDTMKINVQELEQVTGGKESKSSKGWKTAKVKGVKHYLALRDAPYYDDRNEIGPKFYNGDTIQVYPAKISGSYIWARKKAGASEGWVNKNKVSY